MKDSKVAKTKLVGGPNGEGGRGCVRNRSKRGKGRWTREEHESFLKGVELHGKDWKAIGEHVRSRTVVQIRTHAQKYFLKADKGIAFPEEPYLSTEDDGVTDSSGSSDSECSGPSSRGGNTTSDINTDTANNNGNSSAETSNQTSSNRNVLLVPNIARGKRLLRPTGTEATEPICVFRTTRGRAAAAAKAAAEAETTKVTTVSSVPSTHGMTADPSAMGASTREAKRIKLDVNSTLGDVAGSRIDQRSMLVVSNERRNITMAQGRENAEGCGELASAGGQASFTTATERGSPVAGPGLNACAGVTRDVFSQHVVQQQQHNAQPRSSSAQIQPQSTPVTTGIIPWASPLNIHTEFSQYPTSVSTAMLATQNFGGGVTKTAGANDLWSTAGPGLDTDSSGTLSVAIPSKLEPYASTPTGGSPFNFEYMMESFQADDGDEKFINAAAAAAASTAAPTTSCAEATGRSSPPSVTPRTDDMMSCGTPALGISNGVSQNVSQSHERHSPVGVIGSAQSYFSLKTANAWPIDTIPAVTPRAGEIDIDGVATTTAVSATVPQCVVSNNGVGYCDAQDSFGGSVDADHDRVDHVSETFDPKVWGTAGDTIITVTSAGESRRPAVPGTATPAASVAAPVTASSALSPHLAFNEVVVNVGVGSNPSRVVAHGRNQPVAVKSLVSQTEPLNQYSAGNPNVLSSHPQKNDGQLEDNQVMEHGLRLESVGCDGNSVPGTEESHPWMEAVEAESHENVCSAPVAIGRVSKNDLVNGGLELPTASPLPVAGWLAYTGDMSPGEGSRNDQLLGQDPAAAPPTCTAAPVAEPLPGTDVEAEDGLLMFLCEDYFGML